MKWHLCFTCYYFKVKQEMRPEGSRKEEPINGNRHEKRKVREEKVSAILRIIENMNGSYFKLSH